MNEWVVSKFGGSSVKDGVAMLRCSQIIESNSLIKIVVISATQNTTNQLEFVALAAKNQDRERLNTVTLELIKKHTDIALELFTSPKVITQLEELFSELKSIGEIIFNEQNYSPKTMDQLYAVGERMSSLLVCDLLRLRMPEKNIHFLDARKVIKTSSDYQKAEPQIDLIESVTQSDLLPLLNDEKTLFVTQGFIGSDLLGNTTTLGREGSDYSAALFGEAINASLVQIWTDVPGVASADPRVVSDVKYIATLSYDEATAMATLGAKVLFPTTLMPAKRKNIPVFVGSSLNPKLHGTTVTQNQDEHFKLKSVTLLDKKVDKKEFTIISFVGCHLDQSPNLVEKIQSHFDNSALEFYDLTAVSVSFKIISADPTAILLKGHHILVTEF